jgi:beta-glucosidase
VASGLDRKAQEDARRIAFAPDSSLTLAGPEAADATQAGWRITYSVDVRPLAPVSLSSGAAPFEITDRLSVAEGKGWREMVLTRQCLGKVSDRLTASQGAFEINVASIEREEPQATRSASSDGQSRREGIPQ